MKVKLFCESWVTPQNPPGDVLAPSLLWRYIYIFFLRLQRYKTVDGTTFQPTLAIHRLTLSNLSLYRLSFDGGGWGEEQSAVHGVWWCSSSLIDGRGYENSLKLLSLAMRAAWCFPGTWKCPFGAILQLNCESNILLKDRLSRSAAPNPVLSARSFNWMITGYHHAYCIQQPAFQK